METFITIMLLAIMLIVVFAVILILRMRIEIPELRIDVEDDYLQRLSELLIFRKPSGELVRKDDGEIRYFTRREAREFGKSHPYYRISNATKPYNFISISTAFDMMDNDGCND